MQWLITGCSTGLGLDLARSALAAGQKVIATSRDPAKSTSVVDDFTKAGGVWEALDVSSPDLEKQISSITAKHGPVDVLVNNAGFAAGDVFERMDIEGQGRQIMETNFFGVVRCCRAIVGGMRERGKGLIVNVSSAEFWAPHPCVTMYAASKFALEGFSESLQGEVADFGLRVLVAEPGALRSAFLDPSKVTLPETPAAYEGKMVDFVRQAFANMHGTQAQDPKRTADAIVKEVLNPSSDPPMLRMPSGKESLGKMKERAEGFLKTASHFEGVAASCDFE